MSKRGLWAGSSAWKVLLLVWAPSTADSLRERWASRRWISRVYNGRRPLLFATLALLLLISVFRSGQWYGERALLYDDRAMNRPGRACDNRWAALDRIVIVAGHAIYLGSGDGGAQDVTAESSWALEPYQRGHVSTFLAHIETGVRVAAADNRTLLVFSGGDSRAQAGPMNEAESYWRIAQARDWFGHADDVRWRVVTEEFARDSLENLLFSMCRFRQVTQRYPMHITVVSMNMKRRRFSEMHRAALRIPPHRFTFLGIDPPGGYERSEGEAGELVNAVLPFSEDPYGCRHSLLTDKRRARNPYAWSVPYPKGCPEMRALFRRCHRRVYRGRLPWETE
ncbi:hypothetical protein CDCA_CDCA04G1281 [Cyanidium caldarium]|uniref:DUF218 domain-containing protein n=1 Tax=Cyanidium caldarium TaxID=2771 RepID=A0AAV9IT64_CYACA|nr:hypothetical protein CDCA_CDCA04G1281 [Cyanidium caldarium]